MEVLLAYVEALEACVSNISLSAIV